ncbi:MAG: class I SAM-dependent methyltransferase [Thermodesulfobacteriota bacterium]
MKQVSCTVCGADNAAPLYGKRGYTLVRCLSCGLGYLNPQPEPPELALHYQGEYGNVYVHSEKKIRSKLWDARREMFRISRMCKARERSLLDVGASFGYMVKVAADSGWKALGVDPSLHAAAWARENFGVTVLQGDIFSVNVPEGSLSAVTMFDVLEHTFDPQENLNRACALLAPGGLLVLGVPDFGHPKARKMGPDWPHFNPPEHLYYFDFDTLDTLCRRAGFSLSRKFFRFPNRDTLKVAYRKD